MKKDKEIAMLGMHSSLTQNATVRLPTGYVAPAPEPVGPPAGLTGDVPIEIVSIEGAHPDSDVTVVIKTLPGAEVAKKDDEEGQLIYKLTI